MVDMTLVTVHGFWSAPSTWDRLNAVWQADSELDGLRIHGFGYPSPKKVRLPLSSTRVPDFDDIARTLATEYMTVLAKAPDIAFVTHSQGGLILQRFLAWMISQGRARELVRIRTVVVIACPNGGTQYLASIRHVLGYKRHPQAADLETLSKQVAETQRTVLEQIVYASGVDDHQCHIPFHVYGAGSDAIVPAASAQAAFPGSGILAGNHFTILDPSAPGNRTAEVVKHHILTDLAGPRSASSPGAQPAQPLRGTRTDRDIPEWNLPEARGVQIGDKNFQSNVFLAPLSNTSADPAMDPDAEIIQAPGVTNVIDGTIHGSVIQAGTISGPVTINDPAGKNHESPSSGQY
jgi:pimeloyl-ACP methyl ester carboxylesterase